MTLAVDHVDFRGDGNQVDVDVIHRDYHENYRFTNVPKSASYATLDTLFNEDLLWVKQEDSVKVPEESLRATKYR